MFDWLRRKFGTRRTPAVLTKQEEEELLKRQEAGLKMGALPEPDIGATFREAQRLREEKARIEEELRQEKAARGARARKEAEEEYTSRVPPRPKTPEEILAKLPERERKKYEKRIREGERARVEAELEIWESGIPGKKKVVHRVWNPAQQTWEFKEVEVPMSPQERLAEARIQRVGGMLIEEEVASLKQRRRKRTLPYRLARGAGETAKHLTAVGILGVAGTAQAVLPRGEPRRARGLVPRLPLELYGIGTPSINLSSLREAVLPKLRRRT